MLVYRVFTYDAAASPGNPGHPDYLHRPQGAGRCDNPDLYDAWYYASNAEAAIAEVFGDLATWSDDMFDPPYLPSARRALGVFEIPDSLRLADLDDANALQERGLRPTQVVVRNTGMTQGWARSIHLETNGSGSPRWDGVKWWSYWKAFWPVFVCWVAPGAQPVHQLTEIQSLDLDHVAVQAARSALARPRR